MNGLYVCNANSSSISGNFMFLILLLCRLILTSYSYFGVKLQQSAKFYILDLQIMPACIRQHAVLVDLLLDKKIKCNRWHLHIIPFYPEVINTKKKELDTNNCNEQREEKINSTNDKNKAIACQVSKCNEYVKEILLCISKG